MEREGGCSVLPASSMCAKEVEGVQLGWGAAQVEGTAVCEWKGGGVVHCPSCTPGMHAKWRVCRARQERVRQGGGPHRWEEGVHYPLCVLVCVKRVRAWKWCVCDERGDAKGVAMQVGYLSVQ